MTGRVVLFGGSGFIGSALLKGLGREVAAPARSEVDLIDADRLRGYLRPGDVIVNATGYAMATDRSAAGLARFRRDNVEAVRTLATAASSVGAARLLHLSSVAAMGHREGEDLREDDLAQPRTPYGQSKRDAEDVVVDAARDVPVTILRPTSVFGEGRGLAAVLCRIAGLPIVPLPAGGKALIPFSYVGNLVAAVGVALDRPETAGRTFIVGDDRSYRLREVLVTLARALGRDKPAMLPVPKIAIRGMGAAETAVSRAVGRTPLLDPVRIETLTSSVSYSTGAFREATGFVPPFTMAEAMVRIAAWHRGERPR
jgi:UDP-glucose 4-epimerase